MTGRFMTGYLAVLFISAALGFFHLVAIGTFGLTLLEALFSVSFVYALYHGLWLGKPLQIPKRFDVLTMVSLVVMIIVSAVPVLISGEAASVSQSIKTIAHFLYLWLFAFIMVSLPISASQWVTAIRAHFVLSFAVMVFGIYQLPARALDLPLAWIEISNISFQRGLEEAAEVTQLALRFENFYRATSIFSEPSALAGYGAASLAMLIVPLLSGGPTIIKNRTWLIASIIVTVLAIFLAFSMSGTLLVAAIVGLTLLLYPKESWRQFLTIGVVSLVLIVAADRIVNATTDVSVIGLFSQRITSLVSGAAAREETGAIEGESLTQRVADYRISYEVWQESPVTGVGLGNFANSDASRYHNVQFPATTIGSVLAELGIIGLIVFVVFLGGTYVSVQADERRWRSFHRGRDEDVDRLAPILPFRLVLLIIVAFTGNFLVTAVFWYDMVLVLSGQSAIRRHMGIETHVNVYLTRTPWRERWINARTKLDHGAHH
ncbi:MAG: O-antigen ligase domain-containing protein [Ignavibacteriae bacterium]|nr:MAG: O-antigen ligase domain-containing protein [Ignavibacteriota bacterium]